MAAAVEEAVALGLRLQRMLLLLPPAQLQLAAAVGVLGMEWDCKGGG